ncbi:hypothetical protein AB0M34_15095 [Nocardia sp. NPDC050193]
MPLTPDALAGLRVIDLTTVITGPFATAPGRLRRGRALDREPRRGHEPRYRVRRHESMSALSMNLQRNKRTVALDLAPGRAAGSSTTRPGVRMCRPPTRGRAPATNQASPMTTCPGSMHRWSMR